MTQERENNAGFVLPAPTEGASAGTAAPSTSSSTNGTEAVQSSAIPETGGGSDTSSRDLLVGGVILLVLFVTFFFIKNTYATSLVAKRITPVKANAAGMWLFVFLGSLSTGTVLATVNTSKFMTPLFMGPVAVIATVALVSMLVTGRK